ncbi:MAG: hypothetical protein DRP63_06820 [Planctomycetota bacterium]|nr:MAG: hypothetical protein DRP63_06820 [Planctomycetota bacterium]
MRWLFVAVVCGVVALVLFAGEAKLAFLPKEGDKQVWQTKATIEYESEVGGQKRKVKEVLTADAEISCVKDGETLTYTLKPVKFSYIKEDNGKRLEVSSDKEPPEDNWVLSMLKGRLETGLQGIEASTTHLAVGGAFDGKGFAITVASIVLPNKPVKEGESWEGQTEFGLPGLMLPLKLTWEYKLVKLNNDVAQIEGKVKSAETTMKMGNCQLKVDAKLVARIEVKTWHIKDVKTQMSWDFSYEQKETEKMSGKGKWVEEVKGK